MEPLTTFPFFPTFPIEIRLKIWGIALSNPRTVSITCNKEAYQPGKPRSAKSWTSNRPPPALLHVNEEARYEALAFYAPCFHIPTSFSPSPVPPPPIYLNFSLDVLKFADGVLPYIPPTELFSIRSMVLETKDCSYFGHYNMEILKNMKALQELEIWARRGAVYRWDRGDGFIDNLKRDFEEAMEMDPGWECPRVRIFNGETDELGRVIDGGARIPGWTEETAHLFEEPHV